MRQNGTTGKRIKKGNQQMVLMAKLSSFSPNSRQPNNTRH